MNVVILCGGLSTRLGEITKSIPKILLPVGPKTVLEWQIQKIKQLGVRRVVLAAGHLVEVLQASVGNELDGVELVYAIEPQKLGTGGAIKFAMSYCKEPDEPTFILNGDIFTPVSLSDMASELKPLSDGIILAAKVDDVASYGTLNYDEQFHLESFREKEGVHRPGFMNGGIYLFNPGIEKYFPSAAAFSIEYDVFPRMTDLYVYESDRPWIDVGVPERLAWAREHWEVFEE